MLLQEMVERFPRWAGYPIAVVEEFLIMLGIGLVALNILLLTLGVVIGLSLVAVALCRWIQWRVGLPRYATSTEEENSQPTGIITEDKATDTINLTSQHRKNTEIVAPDITSTPIPPAESPAIPNTDSEGPSPRFTGVCARSFERAFNLARRVNSVSESSVTSNTTIKTAPVITRNTRKPCTAKEIARQTRTQTQGEAGHASPTDPGSIETMEATDSKTLDCSPKDRASPPSTTSSVLAAPASSLSTNEHNNRVVAYNWRKTENIESPLASLPLSLTPAQTRGGGGTQKSRSASIATADSGGPSPKEMTTNSMSRTLRVDGADASNSQENKGSCKSKAQGEVQPFENRQATAGGKSSAQHDGSTPAVIAEPPVLFSSAILGTSGTTGIGNNIKGPSMITASDMNKAGPKVQSAQDNDSATTVNAFTKFQTSSKGSTKQMSDVGDKGKAKQPLRLFPVVDGDSLQEPFRPSALAQAAGGTSMNSTSPPNSTPLSSDRSKISPPVGQYLFTTTPYSNPLARATAGPRPQSTSTEPFDGYKTIRPSDSPPWLTTPRTPVGHTNHSSSYSDPSKPGFGWMQSFANSSATEVKLTRAPSSVFGCAQASSSPATGTLSQSPRALPPPAASAFGTGYVDPSVGHSIFAQPSSTPTARDFSPDVALASTPTTSVPNSSSLSQPTRSEFTSSRSTDEGGFTALPVATGNASCPNAVPASSALTLFNPASASPLAAPSEFTHPMPAAAVVIPNAPSNDSFPTAPFDRAAVTTPSVASRPRIVRRSGDQDQDQHTSTSTSTPVDPFSDQRFKLFRITQPLENESRLKAAWLQAGRDASKATLLLLDPRWKNPNAPSVRTSTVASPSFFAHTPGSQLNPNDASSSARTATVSRDSVIRSGPRLASSPSNPTNTSFGTRGSTSVLPRRDFSATFGQRSFGSFKGGPASTIKSSTPTPPVRKKLPLKCVLPSDDSDQELDNECPICLSTLFEGGSFDKYDVDYDVKALEEALALVWCRVCWKSMHQECWNECESLIVNSVLLIQED
ncbi:DNA-dependent ATPase fun30 [Marasmius crinis-equi]|uniref:DNA-dependent ATPase fun30 n=1 Tax=Marasmius crinis-equi TaxID=585013 RepID=A0ABR3F3V5_9AGAR